MQGVYLDITLTCHWIESHQDQLAHLSDNLCDRWSSGGQSLSLGCHTNTGVLFRQLVSIIDGNETSRL